MSHYTKGGNLGIFLNDTNNFDLFYFSLKSEHLTTTKHIHVCTQEICVIIYFDLF